MTELEKILIGQIAASGPIKLSEFMAACLLHPEHGYYTSNTVFGAQGDFVTAPEISPMFGEMIALSLADAWMRQGKPKDAIIVELGPGRGVLMRSFDRTRRVVAGFDTLPIYMVEAADQMRRIQHSEIHHVTHVDHVHDLPERPIFLIANEFLDVLPIRQFKRSQNAWNECLVGVSDNELSFGLGPETDFDFLSDRLQDTKLGDVVEYCPALPQIVSQIGNQISRHGGAALFIDYGDWRSQGNTLQSIQAHEHVHSLAAPGDADMTAHVDFEAVFENCGHATPSRLVTQGVFLERLGITQRAQMLAKNMSGDQLENHISAHRRLVHPDEMGTLFKVMGLGPDAETLPAGLTT